MQTVGKGFGSDVCPNPSGLGLGHQHGQIENAQLGQIAGNQPRIIFGAGLDFTIYRGVNRFVRELAGEEERRMRRGKRQPVFVCGQRFVHGQRTGFGIELARIAQPGKQTVALVQQDGAVFFEIDA